MNDFTKEELMDLKRAVLWVDYEHDELLADKIQSMIDNYCQNEEKEIYSCHTALAVSDSFFCQKQHMTSEDLLPAIHQLVQQCDGIVKLLEYMLLNLKL